MTVRTRSSSTLRRATGRLRWKSWTTAARSIRSTILSRHPRPRSPRRAGAGGDSASSASSPTNAATPVAARRTCSRSSSAARRAPRPPARRGQSADRIGAPIGRRSRFHCAGATAASSRRSVAPVWIAACSASFPASISSAACRLRSSKTLLPIVASGISLTARCSCGRESTTRRSGSSSAGGCASTSTPPTRRRSSRSRPATASARCPSSTASRRPRTSSRTPAAGSCSSRRRCCSTASCRFRPSTGTS